MNAILEALIESDTLDMTKIKPQSLKLLKTNFPEFTPIKMNTKLVPFNLYTLNIK